MASTCLLDSVSECPDVELAFARRFVAACRFQYAKSVPDSPHEYCLRRWIASDAQSDYDRFVALIAERGYRGCFLDATYRYLKCSTAGVTGSPSSYFPPAAPPSTGRTTSAHP